MEYRQNADWREDDHPRDDDGKFTEKGDSRTTSKSIVGTKPNSEQKSVKLSKRDYAIVYNARAQKFAQYRRNEHIPKKDYVFTKDYFVVFNNKGITDFSISKVIKIEGNEEKIAVLWREIDEER